MKSQIKLFFAASVAILIIGVLTFAAQSHTKHDESSDIRDMQSLFEVGATLIAHAKKEGVFPKSLDELPERISFIARIDFKRTAYSPPSAYPASDTHILLAIPTEHGMAIVYGNGMAIRFNRKE